MTNIVRLSIFFVFLQITSCSPPVPTLEEKNYTGYAQGTTFQIKYLALKELNHEKAIDSIFHAVDYSVNTYDSTSLISAVNKGDTLIKVDAIYRRLMKRSIELWKESKGLYDVSVGPLTELWGFGLSKRHHVDSNMVDSTLHFVGLDSIYYESGEIRLNKGSRLDFNSIAQGLTVDLIAEFLEHKGVVDYMVEVGGEVRARGKNSKEKVWKLGIDKPTEDIDETNRFQIIVELKDASLASSGNYRKFWVDEETGIRYSHTINPKTGYPAKNRLLGVSIISPQAMEADAYATYCMVIGVQQSIELLNSKSELEGYLIYTNENNEWEVYQTEGFRKYIVN